MLALFAWGLVVLAFSAGGLADVTRFWWLVLLFGAVAPVTLVAARGWALRRGAVDGVRRAERELLAVLREHGELTPTATAMLTPLTAAEAAEMLERLAREEHLEARVGDGAIAYALRERDRLALSETPRKTADGEVRPKQHPSSPWRNPLSSRELAVLEMLADGRTNREMPSDSSSPRGPSRPTWRASTASSRSTPAPRQSPGRETSTYSISPKAHQDPFGQNNPSNPPV